MHIYQAFIIICGMYYSPILGGESTVQAISQTFPRIMHYGVLKLGDNTSMVSVVSRVIASKRITKDQPCALLAQYNAIKKLINNKDPDIPNFFGICHQNDPENVTLYAELSRSKNDIESQLRYEKNRYTAEFASIADQLRYKKSCAALIRAIGCIAAFWGTLGILHHHQYSPVKTVLGAVGSCWAIGETCYLLVRMWQIKTRYKKLQALKPLSMRFSPLISLYSCFEQQEVDGATRTALYQALHSSLPPENIHYHRVITTNIPYRLFPSGVKTKKNIINRSYIPCLSY